MDDFCDDLSGPYRVTVRGARATVVETRGEVLSILEAMTPETRAVTTIEVGWRTETGDDVHDLLSTQCGGTPTMTDAKRERVLALIEKDGDG